MVTSTTTIGAIPTGRGWCAAERDDAGADHRSGGQVSATPFTFAALYRAWQACRRGKRGTRKAQRYETRLLDNLVDTVQALQQHTWRPSRAIRFITIHPKPREIHASEFGDRVVHHLLVPWFERLFEPVFIADSFANRRGKGSHAAVARLQAFTRAATANGHRPAYYLQLDIANFFISIDRRRLFGLLRGRVERDLRRRRADPRWADPAEAGEMLWLARVLLTGNPALQARYQGPVANLKRVPAHKQLLNAPAEKGLPIGNLSSQFFSNVYLNELDPFVKHQLKVRHYLRYVDDFVLLADDPAALAGWRERIEAFLAERLGLALRDQGRLAPVSNGIDFLGYIVRPHYRLVRRRVVGHLRDRLARHRRRICRSASLWELPPGRVDALQATLASYFGHFRHAQAARLRAAVFRSAPWLAPLLRVTGGGRRGPPARLRRLDRPAKPESLAMQVRWFRARLPQHLLIVQVGNRWEAYGADAECLQAAARPPPAPWGGFSQPRPWRRPVAAGGAPAQSAAAGRSALPGPVQVPDQQAEARKSARTDPPTHGRGDGQSIARRGLPAGLSWPLSAGDALLAALRRRQIAYACIAEHGWVKARLKRRQLRALYVPTEPAPGSAAPAINTHVPGVQP